VILTDVGEVSGPRSGIDVSTSVQMTMSYRKGPFPCRQCYTQTKFAYSLVSAKI